MPKQTTSKVRFKKRIFAALLSMTMAVSYLPVFADDTSEDPQEVKQNAEVLLMMDFEDGKLSSGTAGTVSIAKDENADYGKVLELESAGSSANAFFTLPKNVEKGKLAIGYDMKYMQTTAEGYNRILRNRYTSLSGDAISDLSETFIVRNIGVFQQFKNGTWDPDGGTNTKYEADKWYHIDMWFDLDERTAEYYIDGQLMGKTSMADKIDKIGSFYHTMGGVGSCYLDNVYAVEFYGGGVDMSKFDFIQYYPPEVEQKITTKFNMNDLGNISFNGEIGGKVDLKEVMGESFSGKTVVKMYDEDGISQTQEFETQLKANEEKEIEFKVKAEKYGYCYLETEVIKDNGEVYGSAKTTASNVVKNETSNPQMAYSIHISKGHGLYENQSKLLEIMKNTGADSVRDELLWTETERTQGILEFCDSAQMTRDNIKASGERMFAILGYYYPGRYDGLTFPQKEPMLTDFLNYVEYVVENTKDMNIDFELWNELNMGTNPLTGTTYEPEYTKLLKLVYQKVKSINPNANVYAFATANVENAPEWIENCLKLGAGDYLDGITIHPYNVTLTAEGEKTHNDIKKIQDLMVKYGIGDKKLVFSEFGWSSSLSFADEEKQANYMPEFMGLMTDQNIDRIIWYNFQEKSTGDMTDGELHFGSIRGWQFEDIPFEAKPSLLTISAYNKLMNGAVKTGKMSLSDENASVYTFKMPDGRSAVMAWSDNGNVSTALNFGTESLRIYDRFGNEESLNTVDGAIDLKITNRPIYIIGDFDTNNIKEETAKFNVFANDVTVVNGDITKISGTVPNGTSDKWAVETVCPDNITQTGDAVINSDGKFEINFKAGNSGRDIERIKVMIKDKANGNVVYIKNVDVKYTSAMSVESSIKYYRNGRWKLILRLQNHKSEGNLSGKIKITDPFDITLNNDEATVTSLEPGGVRYKYINLPVAKTKNKLDVKGCMEVSNGETVEFSDSSYFVGMIKSKSNPKIDGVIESGEYATETPIRMNRGDMIQQITDWGGENDLSGNVYLNFDKDFLYLAAQVKDDREGATAETADKLWQNDSIQFAFAERAASDASITEIGIGKLKNGESAMYRWTFLGTKFFAGEFEEAIDFDERCELEIGRDGDITTYELKIPWVDIYGDSGAEFARKNVLFSIIINDNDGSGRRGWIELSPGIGGSKNASLFMKVPVSQ